MDVGVVLLPDLDVATAVRRWQEAEQAGFSSAWTYDHLSWRTLRDGPWHGAVPLLAAVGALTSRIRLGTLVTSPNFRHPALLAKDAMTIDHITAGRFSLGVGAGGTGFDAHVLGGEPLAMAERSERFADFVSALDVLLREPRVSYSGSWFTVVESRTEPGCVQRPRIPFTIAAAGPRALEVAARHGSAWVTFGPITAADSPDAWHSAVRRQAEKASRACESTGRDPASLDRIALAGLDLAWAQASVEAWDEWCGRLSDAGFTTVVLHWPRPHDSHLPGPPPDVFDEICHRLH